MQVIMSMIGFLAGALVAGYVCWYGDEHDWSESKIAIRSFGAILVTALISGLIAALIEVTFS